MGIARKKGAYVNGKHDLFAVVIALKYLIPDGEFKEFKRKLIALIDKVNKGCPHLTQKDLFNYMGFPSNWEKIIRYKK
jgi:hypothetical protein